MAIVRMNNFTLLTFEAYKEKLLKELQKFENVHFKDLREEESDEFKLLKRDSSPEVISQLESELAKVKFVLENIKPYAEIPTGLKALQTPMKSLSFEEFDQFTSNYDYIKPYEAVKEKDEELKSLKAEKNKLLAENEGLRNWQQLDVSLRELDQLKTIRYFTGTVNKNLQDSIREGFENQFPNSYLEFLGSIKDELAMLAVVSASQYEEASNFFKNAGFSKISLNFAGIPNDIIEANTKRIAEIILQEEAVQVSIKDYAGEYDKLLIVSDYLETALVRAKSCDNFLRSDQVVFMEGWVPQEDQSTFENIISSICGSDYYLEAKAEEYDSSTVPIKLKNGKVVSAFESITSMYSMPRYNELDPTGVLTPFYIMFFGIMVGDIGYGLLLCFGTLFAMKKLHFSEGMKSFIQFFFYLSFSIMAAGVIFNSFFGYSIPALNLLVAEDGAKKAILDVDFDIVTMLILSIVIGVIQIIFGLCVKGYMLIRDGHPFSAVFDSLFYITTLLGGIGWIVGATGMIPPNVSTACAAVFFISMIGLALTQGRESPSIGGKIGNGLYAVYGLTSYVGDIVSYTRLVALMLSGAYIAYSFNLMGDLFRDNTILWLSAGTLIKVLGQTLNIGLALLGAYVHTCRLQYVEYFGKFYEGGGKTFKPLKLKNTHVNIIK